MNIINQPTTDDQGDISTKPLSAYAPLEKQVFASSPVEQVWVNASAGSGKTKILTDRILRLLLPKDAGTNGTPPDKILALTYTKAGASEMISRIHTRLTNWAAATDEDLAKDLANNLLGRMPRVDELTAARQLLALVLDTAGGLKIMTIHSFCQSVLARFPLEAGLSPGVKPIEEADSSALWQRAQAHVLENLDSPAFAEAKQDLNELSAVYGPHEIRQLLQNCYGQRERLEAVLKRFFGAEGIHTALCQWLSINPAMTEQDLLFSFFSDPARTHTIRFMINVLETKNARAKKIKDAGTSTNHESLMELQKILAATAEERTTLYELYRLYFYQKTKPVIREKARKDSYTHSEAAGQAFDQEANALKKLREDQAGIRTARMTRALFRLAQNIHTVYREMKFTQGLLDYDDMIHKTLALLRGQTQPLMDSKDKIGDSAHAWVLYKLDGGLDHLLIDEAQDTSPLQWEILKALSEDFFSGVSTRMYERTLFVVGDEKQSIYSFQGAQPEKFHIMRAWYDEKIAAAQKKLQQVDMTLSFRSTKIILSAVNATFEGKNLLGAPYLPHNPHRTGLGGQVCLWPMIYDDPKQDEDDGFEKYTVPKIKQEKSSYKLAKKIGDEIKALLESNTPLHGTGRAIAPQDILILLRTRNAFAKQLIRVLKTNHVPVSGADKMSLSEEIVIDDLCAAANFALLPQDDYALACLLKSPFIGINDHTLENLTINYNKGQLWGRVKESLSQDIVSWLEALITRAEKSTVFDFFNALLQHPCPQSKISGLSAIRVRLGEDSLDPLEEFLTLSLHYQQKNPFGGLNHFLHDFAQNSPTIMRKMEEPKDSVRIMTIHAAKGLQAPIVFLPDTIFPEKGLSMGKILWPSEERAAHPPFIIPRQDDRSVIITGALDNQQAEQFREYFRLLYVAMTRAEERLYVAGYAKNILNDRIALQSWYTAVADGLRTLASDGVYDQAGGKNQSEDSFYFTAQSTKDPDQTDKKNKHILVTGIHPPDYCYERGVALPPIPKIITPSDTGVSDVDVQPMISTDTHHYQTRAHVRGLFIHKLLQYLPPLKPDDRKDSLRRYIQQYWPFDGDDIQEKDTLSKEVMRVLDDPRLTHFWRPYALAEVPIYGYMDKHTLLSGQIDRMVILQNEIHVLDFKTGGHIPKSQEDVPKEYKSQMHFYGRALKKAYPDYGIRLSLLWTAGAVLMNIPFVDGDGGD